MISKKIDRSGKTSNFERLGRYLVNAETLESTVMWTRTADYILDDTLTSEGEKVLWYRISNCESEQPAMAIAEVELTQSRNTRSKADRTMHLVVSFPEGEIPTREQLEDIEDEICKALGYGEHQRISAVHQDTENRHLHIAINKIHPTTFNIHDPGNDYYIRDRVCRELELKHGLTKDNGIGQGKRLGKAQEVEAHTGEITLLSWIQEHAKDNLVTLAQRAENWKELHAGFAEYNLIIKPHGNGLVIGTRDGDIHIKASSVSRELSAKKLFDRLGDFQVVQHEGTMEKETRDKPSYSRAQGSSGSLYQQYQERKQEVVSARRDFSDEQQERRTAFDNQLKAWHQVERSRIQNSSWSVAKKKDAYSRLSQERKERLEQFKAQTSNDRNAFSKGHTLGSWEEYLVQLSERGNTEALTVLRRRKIRQEKAAEAFLSAADLTRARHVIYADLKPFAKKNGELLYQLKDGGTVTDEHSRVRVDKMTSGAAFLALTLASDRFQGQPLDVQGTDEFKRQVVEMAVKYKMPIRFKSEALEKQRQERLGIIEPVTRNHPNKPLQAYIERRNELVGKASDVLPHREWVTSDAGEAVHRGRRNLSDGSQVILLENNSEIWVKPVKENELLNLRLGQSVNVSGSEISKTKGYGYER